LVLRFDSGALLAMTNRTWLKIGLRILIIGVVCLNIIKRWLKALIKGSISFGSRQCARARRCEGFYRLSHHDKSHVERVYRLALRIAEEEGGYVDLDVIRAAVLLHDVARAMEDEGKIKDHAFESAEIARKILLDVGFPREKMEKVLYCIRVHRFRDNSKPNILEAQILQDADRLDMLGAIGIARVFNRGGWGNIPIYDP